MNKQQLFIDVSGIKNYIKKSPAVSGVQRVLFELIKHSRSQKFRDVYLSFFNEKTWDYVAIPLHTECGLENITIQTLREILWFEDEFNRKFNLEKYKKNRIKYKLKNIQAAVSGRAGKKPSDYFSEKKIKSQLAPIAFSDASQSGDTLLLMDAHIAIPGSKQTFENISNSGVNIVQFIHDLIPHNHPHLYYHDHASNFSEWLKGTTSYTAKYICNSEKSKSDTLIFLENQNKKIATTAVPLARSKVIQDITSKSAKEDLYPNIKGEVRATLVHPYVLCVGTQEIRKNNWRLASAWDRLLSQGMVLPKLIFAGKRGWLNDDFENFLKQTGNIKGFVTIISEPSDVELDFLYENCLFTAYVSLCEGWGIPIGEAVAYGKSGVYSSAQPMPEVGGDTGIYCDPTSIEAIADALKQLLTDDKKRNDLEVAARRMPPRTWTDVAKGIFQELTN